MIYLCGVERHVVFATSQECYDQVSEVTSRFMIYHYVEEATFSFPYHSDAVIGSNSHAIFVRSLSRYTLQIITHARCLCRIAKLFSAHCEIHATFCGMIELL